MSTRQQDFDGGGPPSWEQGPVGDRRSSLGGLGGGAQQEGQQDEQEALACFLDELNDDDALFREFDVSFDERRT